MLELNENQLQQLAVLEARGYVDRIHDDITTETPEQNEPQLRQRLYAAYDHAIALGLHSPGILTQFLYFEAAAPGFYKHPAVDAWLRKPGAPAEQRWTDLLAIINSKLPKEHQ
jgi:hypothetical protein